MAIIKRRKLADGVMDEITRRIESGELKEGDKLPNQNQFAAELGVSRPSLREALQTLTLIGAIEQKPGLGTVIRAKRSALMAGRLSPPLVSDAAATMDLLEARRYIELAVVDLAVPRATKAEIREMEKLILEMKTALEAGQSDAYTQLDLAFHYQAAHATHNRFLIHIFVTIRALMEQFMRETFTVLPGLLQRSLGFHTQIFEGVRDRDLAKAADAMRRHLDDIEKALKTFHREQGKGASPAGRRGKR
ncbi:MAG: FadR/GntR family transcriptional regulator [Pseudomonadota bacterium]